MALNKAERWKFPLYKSHAISQDGNSITVLIAAVKVIVWSREINCIGKETLSPQPGLVPVPSCAFHIQEHK